MQLLAKIKEFSIKYSKAIIFSVFLLLLYFSSFYSYLLFHTLSEIISAVVAFGIFVIIWNSRKYIENNYFLVLGISYFFIGLVGLLHTLAYKGMGVFLNQGANFPTQLWLVGRYLSSASFVVAGVFGGRKMLKSGNVFWIYFAITSLLLVSIFYLNIFPAAYIDGVGQTSFKINSEYFISALFIVAMAILFWKRQIFEKKIFYLLMISIGIKVIREIIFTFYVSVYDSYNLIGHLLLVTSYYLIYIAIVEEIIKRPFRSLFKGLKDSEMAAKNSEEKYRSLVELSPDTVWVHSKGKIIYINSAGVILLGAKDKKDIIGKNVVDFVHPAYVETIERRIKNLSEGKFEPPLSDLKILKLNGEIIEAEISGRSINYEGGISTQCIIRDITKRKESEEIMREAVDLSERVVDLIWEPFIVIDGKFKVKSANKAFYDFFEESKEKVEGKGLLEINGRSWNIPELIFVIKNTIEKDMPFHNFELRASFPKIGEKIVFVSARRIKIPKKRSPLILMGIEDLTDQKRMEDRLVKYAQHIEQEKVEDEAILSSLDDGIVSVDTEGRILYANRAFENIFDISLEKMKGRKIWEINPLLDAKGNVVPPEEKPTKKALANKEKVSVGGIGFPALYLERKSSRIAISVISTPIIIEGNLKGAISIFRDITSEREIDQAKTEFISLASHQLRTPLSGISLSSELLLRGAGGEIKKDQKKYLKEIYESTQRMAKLVEILLNISRIEMGTMVIKKEPVNFQQEINAVVKDLRGQISEKRISFVKKFSEKIETVNFDKNAIRIMTENLISNAVRYTPPKGVISVSIEPKHKKILIKVSDNGCGIPKKDNENIFTKLFRSENAKAISSDGVGLGLYMTKLLADRTNSKIWFKSKENKGTTFFVSIPTD